VRYIRAPLSAPLRVDFAGGWLDVPAHARPGAFVVNCAISPTVSLRDWAYERNAGLGGSGAWALLNGVDGVHAELQLGVGWQDPAVISETGLCVWRSGPQPSLEIKLAGDFLRGRMALYWTGAPHDTPAMVGGERDYAAIAEAGAVARAAVWGQDIVGLAHAVALSHRVQRREGMAALPGDATSPLALPIKPLAWKYCGGGFGGYALYLCADSVQRDALCTVAGFRPIEPFLQLG
jgi:hypothetical protein